MRNITNILPRFCGGGVLLTVALLVTSGCSTLPSDSISDGLTNSLNAMPDSDFESQLSLARLVERHGQTRDAKRIYEAIVQKNPSHQQAQHRLGVLAARDGNWEVAENYFTLAAEAGEPNAELLQDHGYLLYLTQDFERAKTLTQQALKIAPENKAARNNLALILGELGDVEGSLTEFRKIVGEAESHANLAYIYAMHGDFASAEQELHAALDLDPDLDSAAAALVYLHERQDRSQKRQGRNAAFSARSAASRSRTANQVSRQAVGGSHTQDFDPVAATDGTLRNNAPQSSADARPHENPQGPPENAKANSSDSRVAHQAYPWQRATWTHEDAVEVQAAGEGGGPQASSRF